MPFEISVVSIMETTSSDSELEVVEGLQQLVVNGEYKTVYLNDYVIIQSLQRAFLFPLFCRGQSHINNGLE